MSIKEKILKPAYVTYAKFLESNKNRHLREMYRQGVARGEALRKKNVIKVLFILPQLPKWKTETLYLAMREHPRFEPMIAVAVNGGWQHPSELINQITTLEAYLKEKSYPFREICFRDEINKDLQPDIVFYQQAHGGCGGLNSSLQPQSLENCVFCYINYGFGTIISPLTYDTPLQNVCWKQFAPNDIWKRNAKNMMLTKGENVVVTGHTIADMLMASAESDPWKAQDKTKKRIIWAPHHSIETDFASDMIHYGNFLQYADFMVELAERTADTVQWAFKPHPTLNFKLRLIWGEEKTEAYYQRWATMPNTQLEQGAYADLFKHSDAMVHDCCSFIAEYLYMHKPCMYVNNGNDLSLNEFGQGCHDVYYQGSTPEDIEQFVQNVVAGIDPRRDEREAFFAAHLLPPNGRTATENIIAAILGEPPY